jgi:RND family efflux transporter MFP subunit
MLFFMPFREPIRRRAQLVLAASALVSGCSTSAASVASIPDVPARFPVVSPETADTVYEREYVGEVKAARYAEIRSRVQGIIENVAVDEGQRVKAGDALFTISAREAQQELMQARAATKSAEAEIALAQIDQQNTQMLFDKKVVSSAEMALATAKIEALRAQLEEAKAAETRASIDVSYAQLRAPFDGIVNRIPLRVGSVADEDTLLTTLADTSEVYVYFRVSEREYLEHMARAPEQRPRGAKLRLADGTIHPSTGVIDAVESEINPETGTLAFRARFPNPSGALKHGGTGKIVIETSMRNALLVPQKSTFEIQGNLYVYAVDAENKARARAIVPLLRVKDSFVISSGLSAEDRFVLEGIQKVKDGAPIEAVLPPS